MSTFRVNIAAADRLGIFLTHFKQLYVTKFFFQQFIFFLDMGDNDLDLDDEDEDDDLDLDDEVDDLDLDEDNYDDPDLDDDVEQGRNKSASISLY